MTYAASDAEQAFFKAVAAVFAEHREVSSRFGLCDVDRLAEVFGQGRGGRFGLRHGDSGSVLAVPAGRSAAADVEEISPTFPASVQNPFGAPINPATGEPEGACLVTVPDLTGEGVGWSCVTYLSA